jgi:hypothetical protein
MPNQSMYVLRDEREVDRTMKNGFERTISMLTRIRYYFANNRPEQTKIIALTLELEKELFYFIYPRVAREKQDEN